MSAHNGRRRGGTGDEHGTAGDRGFGDIGGQQQQPQIDQNSTFASSGAINTAALTEAARKDLCSVLDSVRGKKDLVLDRNLSGPLSLITEFSLLQEHGVEKIYYLQPGRLDTQCRSLIYLCRPKLQYMGHIAEQIKQHTQDGHKIEYSLFFVPRRSMICERLLEEAGVYGDVTIGEYALEFIPLEDDLLSLEIDSSFKDIYFDRDLTAVYYVANALMRIQRMYGLIPRILGKGDCAKNLVELLLRMRRELAVDDPAASLPISPKIDSLIILDRSVDYATPLLTQLTYEGLVDEVYGIRNSFVELDAQMAGLNPPQSQSNTGFSTSAEGAAGAGGSAAAAPSKKRRVQLNNDDRLFSEIRDLNFAVVGGILNRVAKRINIDYEARHQAKTVGQIREFVGKLGDLQAEHLSLRIHTAIAEGIMANTVAEDFNRTLEVQQNIIAGSETQGHIDYMEELIHRRAPLEQVLRLLCLRSTVSGGLKAKQYDHIRREIVQTYGYAHVVSLGHLARLSLFMRQDFSTSGQKSAYTACRRSLRLIVDEVDEQAPNDVAYVYSGYAPLSVRLIQCALQKPPGGKALGTVATGSGRWKGWEAVLRSVSGTLVEEVQRPGNGTTGGLKRLQHAASHPRVTLVMFLGGCTFTEVSAIRFLGQQEGRDFVICTTQIINGNSLLKPFIFMGDGQDADR